MARIYADVGGNIVAYASSDQQVSSITRPPSATQFLDFDAATDPNIDKNLADGNWSTLNLQGGVLTRNGQVQVINAASPRSADHTAALALTATMDAVVPTWTSAQVQTILRDLWRRMNAQDGRGVS